MLLHPEDGERLLILVNHQSSSLPQWIQGWWAHTLGADQLCAAVGLDIHYGITVPHWEHWAPSLSHRTRKTSCLCNPEETAWWQFLADSARQCSNTVPLSSTNPQQQPEHLPPGVQGCARTPFQPPLGPGSVGTFTWISRGWVGFRHLVLTPGGCTSYFHHSQNKF